MENYQHNIKFYILYYANNINDGLFTIDIKNPKVTIL